MEPALIGKALCGLASVDEARGRGESARELYEQALEWLTRSTHPDAVSAMQSIRVTLGGLTVRR